MANVGIVVSSIPIVKRCVDHIRNFWHVEGEPAKVLVTGAAGDIGYAIVPLIARGLMLGANQPVILHMLDKDAKALEEVKMELIDAAFPLLKGVVATTKDEEAWKGVQVAVMIVGLPRTEGMNSEDASIYEDQALALGKHADKDCKVLVVPNPANAKALKLEEYEGPIPKENITYLTRLEHNRALGQIAEVAKVPVSDVKNVIIRGENYSTRCPDVKYAIVTTPNGEKSVKDYVANDHLLKLKLNTTVQHNARKRSSALSTASSACDHVHDWLLGTPKGTWVSMGVYSNGSYGSFPVTCDGTGKWFIKSLGAVSDKTTEKRIVDKRKTKALARP